VAEVAEVLRRAGIVAVLDGPTTEHLPAVAEVLVTSGIRVLEVALTVPGALDCLAQLAATLGGDAVVGAGGVLTAAEAEDCANAGAQFLVSPASSPDVIAAARIAGLANYPGALTPSEALAAHRSGATGVAIFPASAHGPQYISTLRGAFPHIEIVVAGGIDIASIPDWLDAGAIAVGLGRALLRSTATDGVDPGLRTRSRQAVAALRQARSQS
jgi:2-dehydro-3-deoxyphosphogluconate aldolase/(4S)-4-hydroxy-2-oxoglutarate aldolase